MDLLEIRKKAKRKKEAEEKAALEAGKQELAPGETGVPEAPPGEQGAPPRKRPAGKKRQAAARKPAKPRKGTGDEMAIAPPGPGEAPVDEPSPAAEARTPEELPADEPARADAPSRVGAPPESPVRQTVQETVPGGGEPALEDDEAEGDGNLVEYLAFMLSDEEYAVKVEDVKEIIRLQKITTVPRAEGFVEGIISLRGVIIPVFDIKRRLGFEQTDRQRTARIVIVSEDDSPQGIIVDKVTGVARLREDAIEAPPAVIGGVEGEYLEGVGRIDDRLLILFNTGKVLAMDSGGTG